MPLQKDLIIAGWGYTQSRNMSDVLRQTSAKLSSQKQCALTIALFNNLQYPHDVNILKRYVICTLGNSSMPCQVSNKTTS